jgi:hypothetical protein
MDPAASWALPAAANPGPAGGCHGPVAVAPRADAATVALLGLPNTGKSTLYSRLTGRHAHIANWPGLTVDLLRGDLPSAARRSPFPAGGPARHP